MVVCFYNPGNQEAETSRTLGLDGGASLATWQALDQWETLFKKKNEVNNI